MNYPPGVTEGMIPGCRDKDAAWERFIDEMIADCEDARIDTFDAKFIWRFGLAVWRVGVMQLIRDERKDERDTLEVEWGQRRDAECAACPRPEIKDDAATAE